MQTSSTNAHLRMGRCVEGFIVFLIPLLHADLVRAVDAAEIASSFIDLIDQVIHEDTFDGDLSQWVVEQRPGGSARLSDGWLEIDDAGGCTVWFKQKLTAPILIEYDVVMIKNDGSHDNCRDLNCFWMATDPQYPDDIFARSGEPGGKFPNYHDLRLYYVGYGGNSNKTTRFRRYIGTGDRPLLPEHDLGDARHLLQPNARMRIQLVVHRNTVQYIRNGEVIFDVHDTHPYHQGWFGFRTVSNHMRIDGFRVYRLHDASPMPSSGFGGLLDQAGNTADDLERLNLLKQMRMLPRTDEAVRQDADRLIAEITKWTHGKNLPYFSRAVGKGDDYDFGIAKDSPLYPLTHLYQGRMAVQYANEMGGVWGFPDRRRAWMDRAQGHVAKTLEHFPRNRIARLYFGEKIAPRKAYPSVADAPEWAVYQRESLERLTDIIEWWIDHRQQPDGAFGGGWGDDCEMWRSWVPALICFDNPKITQAQARLTGAVMSQPHMAKGYTTHMSDVQHTAEDSADTLTPMMLLEPDNPAWSDKALRIATLMENFWTGINERSHLQFKSSYFTADRIDDTPLRACDTFHHCRTVQPVLLYWQRTADERLTKLFAAWMDTWVDAAARSERGKPAGIPPSAIHWPDGQVGGLTDEWWDPRHYSTPAIYRWPSAMSWLTQSLLLTYHITGDDKYLTPLRSMAAIRLKHLSSPTADPEPGSEAWCAARVGGIVGTLAKYAFLTGSEEFDELLSAERSAYVNFRMKGDRDSLAAALSGVAYALRYNFEGYTSEVRWTDRVFTFPRLFSSNGLFVEPVANFHGPNLNLLYATATGDPGDVGYFPINAVRWLTPSRDIAALVCDAGTDRFRAELFHFGTRPRAMGAELYLLAPGSYTMTLTTPDQAGLPVEHACETVNVTGTTKRVTFDLPAQQPCTLTLQADQ